MEAAGANGTESAKIQNFQHNMKDVHSGQPMTTDYGIKISNPDNWLKIASSQATGPHLLEDQVAREKV